MPAFILAIFLSAFLLFQVQPIIARYILPWYGGSPAVWTTCMLFFQVGLLAGYTYAHVLVSRFRNKPRWQAGIHLALLAVSFLMLPITPAESLKPTGAEASPIGGIVMLLFSTVGLPYIVISASGPLLQHWFGAVVEGKSPYRLYAISNFGSLLGLLSYPVLFEPTLRLGQQTGFWSGGYLVYAALAVVCAWFFLKSHAPAPASDGKSESAESDPEKAPGLDRILWIAFAACGSILLLATTNQMCQDVAVVPFLWVLPLSLYLITFIISFDHARWYWRPLWIPLAAISIGSVVYLLNQDFADTEMHLSYQIAIYAAAMFAGCMVCHGEMVRLKPHPHWLTSFYLSVSLGGALGGACVSLLAPRIFDGYWELHAGIVAFALLSGFCVFRDLWRKPAWKIFAGYSACLWILVTGVAGYWLLNHISVTRAGAIASTRGFYGVLRVYEGELMTEDHYRSLYHGRISHGRQFFGEGFRNWPGTYYGTESGPGILFDSYPKRIGENAGPIKYGVIGLGIGTLGAFAKPGDTVRFYEINSQVEDLARSKFTYLEDCEGDGSVNLGDGRITLERELAEGDVQNFDMLFMDAFSGDSVPIHLLTHEAFELYFKHLNPDGVLVIHITNLHLNLSDPVRILAREFGKEAIQIENDPVSWMENYSRYVLITSNAELLQTIQGGALDIPWESDPREIHWTDDYCNLLQVIDW